MRTIAGTHLIMDGYVVDERKLEPEAVMNMMDALVWALDMQYLQRPVAMRVPIDPSKLESDADEGGWSIYAQITTSHIAVHCWPLRKAFMLDAFSCKPFDADKAIKIIYDALRVDKVVQHVIHREGPAAFD
jgi:S-adenosylmethionine decarboxylase